MLSITVVNPRLGTTGAYAPFIIPKNVLPSYIPVLHCCKHGHDSWSVLNLTRFNTLESLWFDLDFQHFLSRFTCSVVNSWSLPLKKLTTFRQHQGLFRWSIRVAQLKKEGVIVSWLRYAKHPRQTDGGTETIEKIEIWKKKNSGGRVAWPAKHVCLQPVAADVLEFHLIWTHQLPTDRQRVAMGRKYYTQMQKSHG